MESVYKPIKGINNTGRKRKKEVNFSHKKKLK